VRPIEENFPDKGGERSPKGLLDSPKKEIEGEPRAKKRRLGGGSPRLRVSNQGRTEEGNSIPGGKRIKNFFPFGEEAAIRKKRTNSALQGKK